MREDDTLLAHFRRVPRGPSSSLHGVKHRVAVEVAGALLREDDEAREAGAGLVVVDARLEGALVGHGAQVDGLGHALQ